MSTDTNWSYKAGRKGRNRVRAFEKGGVIYLEFYERDPETGELHRKRVSTGHCDRAKAEDHVEVLVGQFAEAPPERERGVTLRTLFDIYLASRTPQVGKRQQQHHQRCAEMFCRYFGWDREAESLNRKDWDRFRQDRASGVIDARARTGLEAQRELASARTLKRDLQALRAVLDWGVGADLLKHNPCARYPYPKVQNQHRPRLSHERYEEMREVAKEVDWRFDLALVLAHETGHRISAIRHLRWSDVDLAASMLRWRAETDKTRKNHFTPLTEPAVKALRGAQEQRAAIGDTWVLPSPTDDSKPISRYLMMDWWRQAEKVAELEHIPGLGWHGLRRKFADDHRHVPLKDLADLGGWETPRTILEVYQGSNLDAMRQAQQRRRGVGEKAASGE